MINVKDEVYAALCTVTDNITDSYPRDWEQDLSIQYMEEDNKVVEYTDMKEQKAYVRYRIDIWLMARNWDIRSQEALHLQTFQGLKKSRIWVLNQKR